MKLEIGSKYSTKCLSHVEVLGRFDPDPEYSDPQYFICKVTHQDGGQTVELYEENGEHSTDGIGRQNIIAKI
jgi:hypothetical protein